MSCTHKVHLRRTYARLKIRDTFREHRSETNERAVASLLAFAQQQLGVIQRQVQPRIVSSMAYMMCPP